METTREQKVSSIAILCCGVVLQVGGVDQGLGGEVEGGRGQHGGPRLHLLRLPRHLHTAGRARLVVEDIVLATHPKFTARSCQ